MIGYGEFVNPGDRPKEMLCDLCGDIYDITPFANMLGNGEVAYSTIHIWEKKYDLCPKCTYKLYQWLEANKNTNLGDIISIEDRRKK